jgi:hypothetical protein
MPRRKKPNTKTSSKISECAQPARSSDLRAAEVVQGRGGRCLPQWVGRLGLRLRFAAPDWPLCSPVRKAPNPRIFGQRERDRADLLRSDSEYCSARARWVRGSRGRRWVRQDGNLRPHQCAALLLRHSRARLARRRHLASAVDGLARTSRQAPLTEDQSQERGLVFLIPSGEHARCIACEELVPCQALLSR